MTDNQPQKTTTDSATDPASENLPKRGPGRPPASAPAAGRAAAGRKTRIRRGEGEQDQFFIPPEAIPEGYEVQWNAIEVLGQPINGYDRIRMQEGGWEPVSAANLPESARARLLPAGYKGDNIIVGGQILEIRPKYLGDEARAEELEKARAQRRDKFRELALKDESAMPSNVSKLSFTKEANRNSRREIPED